MDESLQQQVDRLERTLDAFLSEYNRNSNPTSETFTKKVYFKGGVDLAGENITIGSATGSIGLYGHSPVPKASAIPSPSNAGVAYDQAVAQTSVNAINSILTALQNIGIIS